MISCPKCDLVFEGSNRFKRHMAREHAGYSRGDLKTAGLPVTPHDELKFEEFQIADQNPDVKEIPDTDVLAAMESEVSKPLPKVEMRQKLAKKRAAEAEADAILARANARSLVMTIEGAKKICAELSGYNWNGAKLLDEEEREIIAQLTRYLEVVGYDINNPKIMLIMLMLTEMRISVRQLATLAQTKVKEDASPIN